MKFDNAFMCKSGVVGMQFMLPNSSLITVFHDGNSLQASESFPEKLRQAAMIKYNSLHNRFVRH